MVDYVRAVVDFLIIGAQKGGTTAAIRNIGLHPDIEVFSGQTEFGQYELEFFTEHWALGLNWYRKHFNYQAKVVGEKTAELLHRISTHSRMREIAPGAKLVVFLRAPARRTYSQWLMASMPGWGETRTFSQVVRDSLWELDHKDSLHHFYNGYSKTIEPWREGYLAKGLYFDQLKSLTQHFSREQILILIQERVRENMAHEYSRIFDFLGVSQYSGHFSEHFVNRRENGGQESIIRNLAVKYKNENAKLFDFLGYDIPEWSLYNTD